MLERIRAAIPALPPAEQRVAHVLLADPRAFASQPVGELALRSKVSKPTVVRFCPSVGDDGLTDFKLAIAPAAARNHEKPAPAALCACAVWAGHGGRLG